MGFQKSISYKNPRHGAPGPIGTSKSIEELYYPYSEYKGADQLRGHREADLRLCFRICKKPVFSQRGSYDSENLFMPHISLG